MTRGGGGVQKSQKPAYVIHGCSLRYINQGGQIIPTTLLLASSQGFQTFLRTLLQLSKTFTFSFISFAESSSWGMLLRSTRKAAMAGSEKKIPTVSVIYKPAKTGGTASSSTPSSSSYSRAANARYVPGFLQEQVFPYQSDLFFHQISQNWT